MLIGVEMAKGETWDELTEAQICEQIVAEKPDWKRIVGLLPKKLGVTRAIMSAAVESGSLSNKDLIILTPTLEELGLLEVKEVKAKWDRAVKKAEDDMRAANIARNVKSKDVQEQLQAAADTALQKAVEQVTKNLRIYVIIDVSGSMGQSIEKAKTLLGKFLCQQSAVEGACLSSVERVFNYPVSCRQRTETFRTGYRTTQGPVFAYLCRLPYRHRNCSYPDAMSKSSKRSKRSRGTIDRSATTDIVTQLEVAIRNPHAALIGALIGGLVPWFGRTLAHGEIQDTWVSNRTLAIAMVVVVLGCGCFSGLSVYKFGKVAFGDPRKALGFVLALEGVMLVSHGATSAVALITLILINGVSNGAVIALARDASQRKREADARGAATRARSRAAVGGTCAAGKPEVQGPVQSYSSSWRQASEPTQALVAPVWRRATLDDVTDAEIVGEKYLA